MPGRSLSFDSVADHYDQTRVIPPPQVEEIADRIGRDARLERGGLFLDAGVGTGRFAAPLARRFPAQVIGVDISVAMMQQISAKAAPGSLSLAHADLQRLPFQDSVFQGVLMVHILHLIERWPLALSEARRVLARGGTLFLGVEQGGRSVLVDFYFERARARHVLSPNLGSASLSPVMAFLRRRERAGGAGASATLLEAPRLVWKRVVPTAATLEALARRTYSQMWAIPDADHAELLAETERFSLQTFRKADAAELLPSRFSLYAVKW